LIKERHFIQSERQKSAAILLCVALTKEGCFSLGKYCFGTHTFLLLFSLLYYIEYTILGSTSEQSFHTQPLFCSPSTAIKLFEENTRFFRPRGRGEKIRKSPRGCTTLRSSNLRFLALCMRAPEKILPAFIGAIKNETCRAREFIFFGPRCHT